MNSLNRRKSKKVKIFKIFVISLFIIFLMFNYFKWKPFHSVGFWISGPALKTKEVLFKPFDGFFSYFKSKKELENNVEELKKEISNLKIEVLSTEILKYEYQNILKQKGEDESFIEIGKVILKPPYSGFDSLVLSGVFNDSKIGEKVFYRNIFVGEIVEFIGDEAIVKLASSSGNSNQAKISEGNYFEAIGKGYGQYEMTLPKDVEINQGDPIIYPENEIVLFGVVNKVFTSEDDLFNKVLFNTPVDFADLNYVRIGEPLNILD